MRKLLFILLTLFLIQKAQAQVVFCPPGAEWHYLFVPTYVMSATETGTNAKIQYVRDSIMGSDTVKVLYGYKFYPYCNYGPYRLTLIKQKGDTVFMNNYTTQFTWQILYNFAAQPGQGWTTTVGSTYTITVDSVKYITVNSFQLKKMFIKYNGIVPSSITERFGSNVFLFNYSNPNSYTDADQVNAFLCYQDSSFGAHQFSNLPCNFYNFWGVGIKENNFGNAIKIYPNPAKDVFNFSIENSIGTDEFRISLQDVTGRTVKEETLQSTTDQIDLNDLSNGVYIITVTKDKELLYKTKLVKQD